MTLSLDITTDYEIFDNLITVTYVDLSGNSYTINNVKMYPASDTPSESQGVTLKSSVTRFGIFRNELPVALQNNTSITYNTQKFYVIGFEMKSFNTRYVVDTVIAAGTDLL